MVATWVLLEEAAMCPQRVLQLVVAARICLLVVVAARIRLLLLVAQVAQTLFGPSCWHSQL